MTTRSKRRPTRRLTLLAGALTAGLLAMSAAPAAATTAAPDGGAQVAHPLPWDSHAGTHGFHDGG